MQRSLRPKKEAYSRRNCIFHEGANTVQTWSLPVSHPEALISSRASTAQRLEHSPNLALCPKFGSNGIDKVVAHMKRDDCC